MAHSIYIYPTVNVCHSSPFLNDQLESSGVRLILCQKSVVTLQFVHLNQNIQPEIRLRKKRYFIEHLQAEVSEGSGPHGCHHSWDHTYHRKPNRLCKNSSRGRRLNSSCDIGVTQRSVWKTLSPTWECYSRMVGIKAFIHNKKRCKICF